MSSSTASLASTEGVRINQPTSPEAMALIDKVADPLGTSVSAFMEQHAYEAARQVTAAEDALILSRQAFEAFVAACENPPEATAELRRLLAR